jgi:molybdate transport system substrate-binding protein
MPFLHRVLTCILSLFAAAPASGSEPASTKPVTVFAAASLTNVLEKIGKDFTQATGVPVKYSFASSAVLARQVEAGAGVDVFISADQAWMDYLEQRSLIRKSTRRNMVGNRLVLIASAESKLRLKIEPGFAIAAALDGGRLATGDPDSAPAGRYAKQALTSLGVWADVANRLVRADDVRQALMFVASGEAPLGIVYETDALAQKRVRVVDVFPASSHLPITYPVALLEDAAPGASAFADFLRGDAGRATFESFGFSAAR